MPIFLCQGFIYYSTSLKFFDIFNMHAYTHKHHLKSLSPIYFVKNRLPDFLSNDVYRLCLRKPI